MIAISLFFICLSTTHAFVYAASGADEKHSAALISWLKESGGYFHPHLEMRRRDPSDPTSHFGMFATDPIIKGEVMIRVPKSVILDSGEDDPEITSAMVCGTVRNLAEQLKLKDKSKYAPYVNYLLETQPAGQIPSAWTDQGKKLLERVLEGETDDDVLLPPYEPVSWLDDWYNECDGSRDPLEEYAALLVIQRSWDDLLIPLFDMMSHRNGEWWNTGSNHLHEGEPAQVFAKRDIEAGEEIYTTYNHCEDCGARYTTYGTPEILREYGFVEQFPQSWIFNDIDVGFRIDQVYDENDEIMEDAYEITEWIFGEPDEYEVQELQRRLDQIVTKKNSVLSQRDSSIPDNEWHTIVAYAEAMELALAVALDSLDDDEGDYDENEELDEENVQDSEKRDEL
mmetsp:Transcript_12685/g.23773  ORF Transcript_12685/g.23773 Transcript_12685/m.23773 type:complete len:397 (+) Transcript_12685:366-1556(+)|eukprot:CAMPEP_0176493160 /NCGR_PEP_ID=MMETSP0200_2-20121128/9405_1 /TAXON_ID=947934 /ORGANISM="Chaetoceros sp., Strain GSL56" /LENGTH=396 /DNA_ID=CAMNT_0017890813 /DNA_START=296 /DNA_END=1486 /DNA_ORIENTATION=+